MNNFDYAERVRHLPFYLYPTIEEVTEQAMKNGRDIIDLSTGAPKFPTPGHIIKKLQQACEEPCTHGYGNLKGYPPVRKAIASWYRRRFGVALDPDTEVITFVGSKEGLAFFPLAFINPGDVVLIPDPGYPTYRYAASFAGAEMVTFPIRPENQYLPDFEEIPPAVAEKAKIIFVNYPNNPTAATADKPFFEQLVQWAQKFNVMIAHDAAYSEVSFDGYRAPSFLEASGAKDFGVEFHTLSKTYCMPGWRIGFAVGNRNIIQGLLEVKRVSSSGHFVALEMAGVEALETQHLELDGNNRLFQERRDFAISELERFGIRVMPPRGSFYLWFPIPGNKDSLGFSKKVILETGVIIFPGIGYGDNGEGYVRLALVQDLPRLQEAFKRLSPYLITS
ncbi:MAG: aminotransferase class I/II-fold pyridoxal phosphate-dependent enzyme [Thermodesulfobacteriota bacterium]